MKRRQLHALSAAVDLLRMPSKVRAMRSAPLPPGMLLLLRLAAEEGEAQAEAALISRRAQESHRDAAVFFIEQVLLASDSDAHRILGLDGTATISEVRRHMVYLLKWLHPDRTDDPHRARLARRVLHAWAELKSRTRASKHVTEGEDLRASSASGGTTHGRPVKSEPGRTHTRSIARFKSRTAHPMRVRAWPL